MKEKTMDEQLKGNFTANIIPNAGASRFGKRRPDVRGNITAPGSDRVQTVSLWTTEYPDKSTGEMLIGMNGQVDSVSRTDSAMEQIKAHAGRGTGPSVAVNNIDLEAGKIVIFQSKHKDGNTAPNGNLRSDFYGYWNNNGQLVQIGIWAKKNELNQTAFLGGSTQFPLPGKEASATPDFGTISDAELANMAASAGEGPNLGEQEPVAGFEGRSSKRASSRGR